MTRIILPFVLIVAALGLFMMYTNPTYQAIKGLQAEQQQYTTALDQSSQVRAQRDQLLARRHTFSTDDIRKLERMLPDNVDNIRLIIDTNDIAARYHLQVTNVSLNTVSETAAGSIGGGASAVGSVQISFSIAATYDDFLSFLRDLEHSLRLIDVESIKFNTQAATASKTGDVNTYTLTIRTYWLR